MEPEEVDKLFNQRLGRMTPTPPADLWNRLQERMEAELPKPALQIQPEEHQEKRRFGFLYYSIAAAIVLILAVGVVLKFQQPQTISSPTVASADVTKETPAPAETPVAPEAATAPTIAAVTTPEVTAPAVTEEPAIVAKPGSAVAKKAVTRPRRETEQEWVKVEAPQLAQQPAKPAEPKQEQVQAAMQTPVAFASANSAEPVEITIKRSVGTEAVAMASTETAEGGSSFERKQQLAKSIFKQVKNLSNGEKINLAEVGLDADRIALETKIGKQKISKVINL